MNKIPLKQQDQEENVPFNMSMLFYLRLSKIMEFKDNSAINGNFQDWHRSLCAIYRNVRFVIAETKSKPISVILDKAKNALSLKLNPAVISNLEKDLSEADELLLEAMNDKGMIFPDIKTTVGLGALRARYDI